MKRFFFLSVLSLISGSAIAQNPAAEGFIVSLEGKEILLEDSTPRFFNRQHETGVLFNGMNIRVAGNIPLQEQRQHAGWLILVNAAADGALLCARHEPQQQHLRCWDLADSQSLISAMGGIHVIPPLPPFPKNTAEFAN